VIFLFDKKAFKEFRDDWYLTKKDFITYWLYAINYIEYIDDRYMWNKPKPEDTMYKNQRIYSRGSSGFYVFLNEEERGRSLLGWLLIFPIIMLFAPIFLGIQLAAGILATPTIILYCWKPFKKVPKEEEPDMFDRVIDRIVSQRQIPIVPPFDTSDRSTIFREANTDRTIPGSNTIRPMGVIQAENVYEQQDRRMLSYSFHPDVTSEERLDLKLDKLIKQHEEAINASPVIKVEIKEEADPDDWLRIDKGKEV
jgi:hypothetical protein